MSDPVREYLKQKGYAQHVIEGGLQHLVSNWELVVNEIAQGYRSYEEEYLNDMDGRRIIEEVLRLGLPDQLR